MLNAATAAPPVQPGVPAFRRAMGRFPTGVTLLTQGYGAETSVMTLNSLTSVSLEPMLISVSVKADGRMRPRIARHGSFAVHVLAAAQQDLCLEFARPDRPEGEAAVRRIGARQGVTGNAVVPAAVASLECVLYAEHVAGDHTLLIGEVVALREGDADAPPVLFHRGGFRPYPPED